MTKRIDWLPSLDAVTAEIHVLRRRVARATIRRLSKPASAHTHAALPAAGVFRILICRVSHTLGNTLLLTPLLQELETVYPGAEIDIVTRSAVADEVFGKFYSIRKILKLPAWGFAHPLQFLRVLRQMRHTRYDLVIDADPRSQTGRALLNLSRSSRTLGFVGPDKSGNLTHAVAVPSDLRRVGQLPVFLLRSALKAGADTTAREYPLPDIRLSPDERERGREALERVLSNRPAPDRRSGVIGIFANATGSKRLSTEWWTRFLHVLEPGCPDYTVIEIVPGFAASLLDSNYPAYYSSSVRKLGAVLSNLSLYISADCGIMHLACASEVATLGIFNGTDVSEWAPYGGRNHTVVATNRTPEQVAEEALALLKRLARERKEERKGGSGSFPRS